MWQQKLAEFVEIALRHPSSQGAAALRLVLGFVGFLLVMRFTARGLRSEDAGWPRRICAVALGVAIMLAAATATSLYVVPAVRLPFPPGILIAAGATLALLVVAIPVQTWILRGKYGGTLAAFVAGLAAFFMIVVLLNSLSASARQGSKDFNKVRRRTGEINEVMR